MNIFCYTRIRNLWGSMKRWYRTNRLESLLWLVNVMPKFFGFSIRADRLWAPFWVFHCAILLYIYVIGIFEYQWNYAEGPEEFIKSYFSLTIVVVTLNNTWWWWSKRSLLKATLKAIEKSDRLSRRSDTLEKKHENLVQVIKWILMIFYGTNYSNAFLVYWPNRVTLDSEYAMTPCVGLQPLTNSPNGEICRILLLLQEVCISTVVLNFQALLLLLIAHTSVMYRMLSIEMMMLNEIENVSDVKAMARELLPSLICRHSLTLDVVEKLKCLYSGPLGVNFGINAICFCLFCYLPLQEWLKYMPILVYCFLLYFLYCFLGQGLIDASEEFETAVYCCGWENFDVKEKKLVYVMLRQAQKPIQLLAADIVPVNIYTFATTLQGVFKFVTVVKI